MIIRSVKPDEIDKLKELTPDDTSFYTDDIWYEQSKICTDKNGDVLGFILVKPHSLYDFFGGEIPDEKNVPEDEKDNVREDAEFFKGKHYESLVFLKNDHYCGIFWDIISEVETNENGCLIGILWTRNKRYDTMWTRFRNFNDVIYVNIPLTE